MIANFISNIDIQLALGTQLNINLKGVKRTVKVWGFIVRKKALSL